MYIFEHVYENIYIYIYVSENVYIWVILVCILIMKGKI
jgi:hypothetical protein